MNGISTELIGIIGVGVSLAVFIWRMLTGIEARSDIAHENIGKNIDEVKSELRSLSEKVSQNSRDVGWIKGYLMKREDEA